jgi:methylmalonyl-CoA mutase cobalamin-binding subunit
MTWSGSVIRHRLTQAGFDIDHGILWTTATEAARKLLV